MSRIDGNGVKRGFMDAVDGYCHLPAWEYLPPILRPFGRFYAKMRRAIKKDREAGQTCSY